MKIKGGVIPWFVKVELGGPEKYSLGMDANEKWMGYGIEWLESLFILYGRRVD
jgi:hypothetical protein